MADIFCRLAEAAKGCLAERDFSFARHTTVGIGGRAPLCLYPQTAEGAACAVRACLRLGVPFFPLGAGANVLAADGGFDGAVLSTEKLRALFAEGETVVAESGVRTGALLSFLTARGQGGFACMAGIPASVGGAVYMNAGTARGHFGDGVLSVAGIGADGRYFERNGKECAFAYKHTAFMDEGGLILSVRLRAPRCGREEAAREIAASLAARAGLPRGKSMGCVFKNPPGVSAGALIEAAGMKGAREGDAFVSARHANFIVNGGHASAREVRALIGRVRGAVLRAAGVRLEEEIVYIGEG